MVPGGTAPRRLNVNGIKPPTAGDAVSAARSPSVTADDSAVSCFTLSTTTTSVGDGNASTSRTLPCRAPVPPPPPPKPLWPTASRRRTLTEDRRRENEQLTTSSAAAGRRHLPERSTSLEDGGLMTAAHQPVVPLTSWSDQSAATMPMLAEETPTTGADDVTESRGASVAPGTGCGPGGKLAMFFLVAIPVIGIVAAALAWFYSCRQVSKLLYYFHNHFFGTQGAFRRYLLFR